jgi:ring-1,2-phenylacetyl-CoA epoxidase subunit PaaC
MGVDVNMVQINNEQSQKTQESLYRFVLALADDSVVLSHRLSEWCSNGPYLEEDIALANIALDYIGRARMLYQYAAEVEGKNRTEDDLAYSRTEREFTNLLIHELPIGDFAFTMVRQFFLDVFYNLYLEELTKSKDDTVAAIAHKAIKESRYHLKRREPWIRQLAEGTTESRKRVLLALDELKQVVGELFDMPDWEVEMVEAGIAVDRQSLKPAWDKHVQTFLAASDIDVEACQLQIVGGRNGIHSEHLGHMLSEMQYIQKTYPDMKW